jgi:UrcA family protein
MNTFSAKFLMVCALALAAHSADAATREEGTPSMRVRYGDLDLSAPSGIKALRQRILHAATRVCATEYGGDPLRMGLEHECILEATNKAMGLVKWPE